jgi:hypothetical protein
MKLDIRHNKDFWGGVMLIVVGAGAVYIASGYRLGSALKMGPGFFPTVLGVILILFGLAVMVVGLVSKEKIKEDLSPRALILLPLALLLFGLLMNVAGFVPALFVLVFCSAAAGKEFKLLEVVLLSIGLTALSAALFIWGLELPFPLIKGF